MPSSRYIGKTLIIFMMQALAVAGDIWAFKAKPDHISRSLYESPWLIRFSLGLRRVESCLGTQFCLNMCRRALGPFRNVRLGMNPEGCLSKTTGLIDEETGLHSVGVTYSIPLGCSAALLRLCHCFQTFSKPGAWDQDVLETWNLALN